MTLLRQGFAGQAHRNVQMGSWLSSALHTVGGWVAGDGNPPGNKDTRSQGYDTSKVAAATAQILSAPASLNAQQELIVAGVVGLGLILLLRKK